MDVLARRSATNTQSYSSLHLTRQPPCALSSNGACISALLMPSFSYIHNTRTRKLRCSSRRLLRVSSLHTRRTQNCPVSSVYPPARSCAAGPSPQEWPRGHGRSLDTAHSSNPMGRVDDRLTTVLDNQKDRHTHYSLLIFLLSRDLANDTSVTCHMPDLHPIAVRTMVSVSAQERNTACVRCSFVPALPIPQSTMANRLLLADPYHLLIL